MHAKARFGTLITCYPSCLNKCFDTQGVPHSTRSNANFNLSPEPSVEYPHVSEVNFCVVAQSQVMTDVAQSEAVGNTGISAPQGEPIDGFLLRPRRQFTGSFTTDAYPAFSTNIIGDWINSPDIKAKMRNYMYTRFDFNVKITITSTPFNYGHIVCALHPCAAYNDALQAILALENANLPLSARSPALAAYSVQGRYHGIIDLKKDKELILTIPYISPREYYRLSTSSITQDTWDDDCAEACKFVMCAFNPIRNATSDYNSSVTYEIECWPSNLVLSTPTCSRLSVPSQSKVKKGRVKKNGVLEVDKPPTVSSMASAVAQAAGVLSKAPLLRPFASPVEYISTKVAEIAAIFGFSKPRMLTTGRVQVNYLADNATCVGEYCGEILSVDQRCDSMYGREVTGNSLQDELSIQYLCSIPSFFQTLTWNINTKTADEITSISDALMSVPVSNRYAYFLRDYSTVRSAPWVWAIPTTTTFATAPFRYFRGTIVFQFKIVASTFNRGKLGIFFEPNMGDYNSLAAEPPCINTQSCMIVDIAETDEVQFEVEWTSTEHWINNYPLKNYPYSNASLAATSGSEAYPGESIGFLRVVPLTKLISNANGLEPIYINVFMSAKDVRVAVPQTVTHGCDRDLLRFPAQSHVVPQVFTESDPTSMIGESVVSLRTLLKRFETCETYAVNLQFATENNWHAAEIRLHHPAYPLSHNMPLKIQDTASYSDGAFVLNTSTLACQFYPNSLSNTYNATTNSSSPASFSRNGTCTFHYTLFTYLRYAYLGVSGSFRYRARKQRTGSPTTGTVAMGANNTDTYGVMSIDRTDPNVFTAAGLPGSGYCTPLCYFVTPYLTYPKAAAAGTNPTTTMFQVFPGVTGASGIAGRVYGTVGYVDAEIPPYSNAKFAFACSSTYGDVTWTASGTTSISVNPDMKMGHGLRPGGAIPFSVVIPEFKASQSTTFNFAQIVNLEHAISEDFNLFHFLGVPMVCVNATVVNYPLFVDAPLS